uniref:Uncharacterized protein n=1 Tax=Rhizophora mucronata TaxID=61149 RepID=A0A2P2PE60_RHIMU
MIKEYSNTDSKLGKVSATCYPYLTDSPTRPS